MIKTIYKVGDKEFNTLEAAQDYDQHKNLYTLYDFQGKESDYISAHTYSVNIKSPEGLLQFSKDWVWNDQKIRFDLMTPEECSVLKVFPCTFAVYPLEDNTWHFFSKQMINYLHEIISRINKEE